jgi:hypothetical protein
MIEILTDIEKKLLDLMDKKKVLVIEYDRAFEQFKKHKAFAKKYFNSALVSNDGDIIKTIRVLRGCPEFTSIENNYSCADSERKSLSNDVTEMRTKISALVAEIENEKRREEELLEGKEIKTLDDVIEWADRVSGCGGDVPLDDLVYILNSLKNEKRRKVHKRASSGK